MVTGMRALTALMLGLAATTVAAQAPGARAVEDIAGEITASVMAQPATRPLPLVTSFLTGEPNKPGFPVPEHQFGPEGWLKRGYHFLPTFATPRPDTFGPGEPPDAYYLPGIYEAKRLGLPLVFYGTQWELPLVLQQAAEVNGDRLYLVRPDGQRVLLPGTKREDEWYQIGRAWATSAQMKRLMAIYPDPPKVVVISNNEQDKLLWGNYYDDLRAVSPECRARIAMTDGNIGENGPARNCLRRDFGRNWKRLYGKMIAGFRDGMAGTPWASRLQLVGYDAFGPLNVGRFSAWTEYSLTVMKEDANGRPTNVVESWDPWADLWDGGIVSLYTHSWTQFLNDYTRASPQAEAMNLVSQIEEARRRNPNFWFEAGVWDGWAATNRFFDDKRKQVLSNGQFPTPARYGAWTRYVMWMTRAPVVREYRDYNNTIRETDAHFRAVADAVEQVWQDPDLRRFWKEGTLLRNDAVPHPYQDFHEPDGGRLAEPRNYFLNTPDPRHQWRAVPVNRESSVQFDLALPVFTMGLQIGSEFLVYAHAPMGHERSVRINMPGLFEIVVDVPVEGRFWLVRDGKVAREIRQWPKRRDLVFTSANYDERLSPGALGVAWHATGPVTKMTFTPMYRVGYEEPPVPMQILYSDASQTNFVIPKIDVPYAAGGWVAAYRDDELVAEGWLTLGAGSDTLLTLKDVPRGFSLETNGTEQKWRPLTEPVVVQPGKQTTLVLYASGTERFLDAERRDPIKIRVEGYTPGDQRQLPPGRHCWAPQKAAVRIENADGSYWRREVDYLGGVGPGYEQINLHLTDEAGRPLPGMPLAGDARRALPEVPRGAALKVTIEQPDCFRDPDQRIPQGLQVSNGGSITIAQ